MKQRTLVPALLALTGLAILIALGTWQLERKAWKESLIARLEQRISAAPQSLPPRRDWPNLDPAATEFRRVSFRATFLAGASPSDGQARLYTSGSALRDDVKAPGHFVFAPARLPDGGILVVNRGYTPAALAGASPAPAPLPEGIIELVGVLRWPEAPPWFVSPYSAADDLWFARDPQAMAARKGWGIVAPFYVELESPVPEGGWPRPGRLTVNLPNNHLQYALTWYGLAAALVAVFAFWFVRQRHQPGRGEAGGC